MPDRRDRVPGSAESQIEERIGEKVLHGWLQNRQQVLVPLSVNLALLASVECAATMRFAAVASRADAEAPDAAEAVGRWIAQHGGDEAAAETFRSALDRPPPLHEALAAMRGPDLAALAYVIALVAGRSGGPAARAFADYVAAVLALPNTALRSAERRYRA